MIYVSGVWKGLLFLVPSKRKATVDSPLFREYCESLVCLPITTPPAHKDDDSYKLIHRREYVFDITGAI